MKYKKASTENKIKNEKRRFLPARCGTEIESVRFRLRDIKIYTMKSLILAQDER